MLKLIIIDDEYIVRIGLRHTIPWENYGIEVVGDAENGIEGLKLARKHKPEIIITDIYMPEMNGMVFIDCLRKEGINSHVIVLSGYGEFEFAKQAIKNGVSAYLLKPVDTEELHTTINAVKKKIAKEQKQDKDYKLYEIEAEVIKRKLIDDMLHRDLRDEEVKKYNEHFFGFDICNTFNLVLCIDFKNASKSDQKVDLMNRVLQFSRRNCAESTNIDFTQYGEYYALIISFEFEEDCEAMTVECANKIWKYLNDSGLVVSIGVSEAKKGISEMKTQAKYAAQCVRYAQKVGLASANNLRDSQRGNKKLINDIMGYVAANYGCALTTEKVAEYIGISSSHLMKTIKQETGYTLNEYLTYVRIEMAKRMIREERYKVYEIANSIGYTDVKYFTKLFKKTTGFTPSDYLNMTRDGKVI